LHLEIIGDRAGPKETGGTGPLERRTMTGLFIISKSLHTGIP